MTSLPLDLVDKIITVNPNKIISTYLAFANKHKLSSRNTSIAKCRKISNNADSAGASANADVDNTNDDDKYITKYLMKKDTFIRFYKQSSWLKYFISSSKSANNIMEKIKQVANYFNLLDRHDSSKKDVYNVKEIEETNLINNLLRFETILDTNNFEDTNTIETFEKQLAAIKTYYVGVKEIPAFVILVLILYKCGYFESSSSSGNIATKPKIHIFLDMLLEGNAIEISNFTSNTYKYYSACYKFIPLFGIYLGMGYSFVLGWDTEFNGMIGLTENGSDEHEVVYNARRAMRYFEQQRQAIKIDKMRLLEDYMKILGIKDMSILLDNSRRLDICDI